MQRMLRLRCLLIPFSHGLEPERPGSMGRRGLAAKNSLPPSCQPCLGGKLEPAVEDLASGPSGTRSTMWTGQDDRPLWIVALRIAIPKSPCRRSHHSRWSDTTLPGACTPQAMLTGTGRVFLCTVTRNLRVGSLAGRMSSMSSFDQGAEPFIHDDTLYRPLCNVRERHGARACRACTVSGNQWSPPLKPKRLLWHWSSSPRHSRIPDGPVPG